MHEGGGEVETSVEAYGGLFGHRTREHWVERGQVPTMVGDLRWHGRCCPITIAGFEFWNGGAPVRRRACQRILVGATIDRCAR
jgi:hypothetical protein